MVSPQRFGAAAILVNDRRHDSITKGIQRRVHSRLWHKVARRICEGINESVDGNLGVWQVVRANAERRICRGDKIGMKEPAVDLG